MVTVRVHIHKTHRTLTDGMERVDVEGRSVAECLRSLVARFPNIRRVLFASNGELLKNIDIYINAESAYPEELKKPVEDGDEIHLDLMLTGG